MAFSSFFPILLLLFSFAWVCLLYLSIGVFTFQNELHWKLLSIYIFWLAKQSFETTCAAKQAPFIITVFFHSGTLKLFVFLVLSLFYIRQCLKLKPIIERHSILSVDFPFLSSFIILKANVFKCIVSGIPDDLFGSLLSMKRFIWCFDWYRFWFHCDEVQHQMLSMDRNVFFLILGCEKFHEQWIKNSSLFEERRKNWANEKLDNGF